MDEAGSSHSEWGDSHHRQMLYISSYLGALELIGLLKKCPYYFDRSVFNIQEGLYCSSVEVSFISSWIASRAPGSISSMHLKLEYVKAITINMVAYYAHIATVK